MSEKVQETELRKQISTSVNLVSKPGMPTVYAHHIMAQDDDNDIVVSFFEQILPFIPEDEEKRKAAIEKIQAEGVTAECVAKIRIGKHRLPLFAELLNQLNERILEEVKSLGEKYGINPTNDRED